MSKQIDPDSPESHGALADNDAAKVCVASLTDFIDRMDREAFRRALELRDVQLAQQVPAAKR